MYVRPVSLFAPIGGHSSCSGRHPGRLDNFKPRSHRPHPPQKALIDDDPLRYYVHPDPSYKPKTGSPSTSIRTKKALVVVAATLALAAGALWWTMRWCWRRRGNSDEHLVLGKPPGILRPINRIHAQRAYERPGPELSFPLVWVMIDDLLQFQLF